MALTQEQVSQLYVALFGRASETEGNKYWSSLGLSSTDTADEMIKSPGGQIYYAGLSNKEFVEYIYANVLNKTDDAAGVAYWTKLIDAGATKGQVVNDLIYALLNAPENEGTPHQLQFINRVEVSNYLAESGVSAGTTEEEKAEFRDSVTFKSPANPAGGLDVTDSASTVTAAEKIIDDMGDTPAPVPGEEYTLEVSRDKLTGTAKDDLFVADVAQNASGAQVNTLGSGDVLDGGAGTDTLDATLIAAYNVAGKAMDITPSTKSIENIIINAQVSDQDNAAAANQQVILNARKMEGVLKITSDHSDADLVVKNMTTKGVAGGTAAQTVGMEYTTNSVDNTGNPADMTVLYDQDYLTSDLNDINGVYYDMINQDDHPTTNSLVGFPLEKVTFQVNGKKQEISVTSDEMKAITTYQGLVDLLNSKLSASNIAGKGALNFSVNGTFTDTEGNVAQRIVLLSNDGAYQVSNPTIAIAEEAGDGNYYWRRGDLDDESTNNPVTINVDLQKVGQAADGGGLTIGSMNTDGTNVFEAGATTTDTREGFDQFDVTVKGNKTKDSSLSYLESTNNTLRKVTVESETRKDANYANLTIGNSNTTVATPANGFVDSADAANAFKDVQVMDASSFKGDLTLNAGITAEIVEKYLDDNAALNLNGDLSLANEVALFDYNGGAGNDELNIFIDEAAIATTFVGGTKNVFEMDINGGAGNDTITVTFDAAPAATITNISINGGAGNDKININAGGADDGTDATFTVAFNGNFGNDTIIGFNAGVITTTNEVQSLVTTGITVHTNETVVVKIGDAIVGNYIFDGTNYTVGANTYATLDALLTAELTTGANGQFNTVAGAGTLTLTATGKNVETVTVDVLPAGHTAGSYDSNSPIHSVSSTTTTQGGLLSGAAGADVLDFSAYGAKGLATFETTDIGTTAFAAKAGTSAAGQKLLALIESSHKQGVYDVYEATQNATADITKDGIIANGTVLGSIEFDGATTIAGFDATQFLLV